MAIVLRDVTAEILNFEFEKIPPEKPYRLVIRGQLSKQIIYGANKGIVHYQDAINPFETMVELPSDITAQSIINVRAEVEHISSRLLDDGIQVDQQIIIKVYIKTDELLPEQIQNFLFRSVDYLKDIPHLIDETNLDSNETNKAFQKVKVKARLPEIEPKIVAIPDISLIVDEKIKELENTLKSKIHNEVIDTIQQYLQIELEDSIYHRLWREFDTKLEVQFSERYQHIKDEIRQEEQLERSRYYDEIRKRSIQQQHDGYRVKGSH